ncbi:MAG: hypothetical protein H7230_03535 [Candidatus Parcubacteria bacterium]|nr:hypothetical protein [Candidatus Paceibacterota bacterium]
MSKTPESVTNPNNHFAKNTFTFSQIDSWISALLDPIVFKYMSEDSVHSEFKKLDRHLKEFLLQDMEITPKLHANNLINANTRYSLGNRPDIDGEGAYNNYTNDISFTPGISSTEISFEYPFGENFDNIPSSTKYKIRILGTSTPVIEFSIDNQVVSKDKFYLELIKLKNKVKALGIHIPDKSIEPTARISDEDMISLFFSNPNQKPKD